MFKNLQGFTLMYAQKKSFVPEASSVLQVDLHSPNTTEKYIWRGKNVMADVFLLIMHEQNYIGKPTAQCQANLKHHFALEALRLEMHCFLWTGSSAASVAGLDFANLPLAFFDFVLE